LVWIFMGLPGDEERCSRYSRTVERIVSSLTDRFGVPAQNVSALFGAGELAPYEACNAENLTRELERVAEHVRAGREVWVFLLGHANSTRGNVNFNLDGRDMNARELGKLLLNAKPERAPGKAPPTPSLAVFVTTAASGKFLKELAGAGRVLVAAATPDARDNETEFPHALAAALESDQVDVNRDRRVSVLEIFFETKRRVRAIYRQEELVQTEGALLDGNGDGRASTKPDPEDARPAHRLSLRVRPARRGRR